MTVSGVTAPTLVEPPAVTPLRADARRNRERVVAAARQLITEIGVDVQMDDIARRAGVGVGTLYRHFPTKQALLAEIARQLTSECRAAVQRAYVIEDPAESLRAAVRYWARAMASNVGLREVFSALPDNQACSTESEELRAQLDTLVKRAAKAGVIRKGVNVDVFLSFVCAIGSAIERGCSERLVADIVLDGLRVPNAIS